MQTEQKKRVDLAGMVKNGKITWPIPEGRWKVMTFLCVKDGRLVDFHKIVRGPYDFHGESVGFFRFRRETAARLAALAESYIASGRKSEWYEEAVRDLLLERPGEFGFEDVTGLPWIEIDFPEDVAKARDAILPELAEPKETRPEGAQR